ncbi:MAG: hypothetical protein NTX66_01065, partial [Candidatus Falkowbacteria bacterium]|nr:hypothetical protein [Candidatus Falkowbacteria bacterium]
NFSGSKFNKQNYRSDMMPGGRGLRGGRGIPINNLQNPNIPVSGDTNPTGNVTPNNTTTPNNVAPTPTQP